MLNKAIVSFFVLSLLNLSSSAAQAMDLTDWQTEKFDTYTLRYNPVDKDNPLRKNKLACSKGIHMYQESTTNKNYDSSNGSKFAHSVDVFELKYSDFDKKEEKFLVSITDLYTSDSHFSPPWMYVLNEGKQKQIKQKCQLYDLESKVETLSIGGNHFITYYLYTSDELKVNDFLSVFYYQQLLPDCVVSQVTRHMDLKDFRVDPQMLIRLINSNMTENTTSEDAQNIVLNALTNIGTPTRRQEIIWNLIKEITQDDEGAETHQFDKPLVIGLCEQITDNGVSFFNEAKTLQGQLAMVDEAPQEKNERYKKAILAFMSVDGPEKDEQNRWVNKFIHNDQISVDEPLDEKLTNLVVSGESIFNLLDYIRELKIQLAQAKVKK